MLVPTALMERWLDPAMGNGDTIGTKAVLRNDEILHKVVLIFRRRDLPLRIVALIDLVIAGRLFKMNDGAIAVGIILRALRKHRRDHRRIIRSARFDLLDARHVYEAF